MQEETVIHPPSKWLKRIELKTIVKIESLDVFEYEEDGAWPHHQILAYCKIAHGGLKCLKGDIYIDVPVAEVEQMAHLKNIMQPGSILWMSSNSFIIHPNEEQHISVYDPNLERVSFDEQDDLLLSQFESDNDPVSLRGRVRTVQEVLTKKGDTMAFIWLVEQEDTYLTIFPDSYEIWKDKIARNVELEFTGKIEFVTNPIHPFTSQHMLVQDIV